MPLSSKSFDITQEPMSGAISGLNSELQALDFQTPEQAEDYASMYGEGVFGVRFNGLSRLGALIDQVARSFWPDDEPAVAPQSAAKRDHLLVCANFPDGRTEALHYFTTFRPDTANWVHKEPEEVQRMIEHAVNIDSSAKLQVEERIPPNYQAPVSAYLMNLAWLTHTLGYPEAVIEVNEHMERSLAEKWGLSLTTLAGSLPRIIGEEAYKRFIIEPYSDANRAVTEMVGACPPVIFKLDTSGFAIPERQVARAA